MIGIGDVITFDKLNKPYMTQKVTIVERIAKNGLIYTKGNVKPLNEENCVLICKKNNRADI